jgi:proteic killer suppression protein
MLFRVVPYSVAMSARAETQKITLTDINALRYYRAMIKTFANKETAAVFAGVTPRRLGAEVMRRAKARLQQLDAACTMEFLRVPPGNRLEKLIGNRAGQWSIRINDQWRLCFRFEAGDAFEVEIVDYH